MVAAIDQKKTGRYLKQLIQNAGLEVKDVQRILHLEYPQSIYRWFKGILLPSVDHLYVLSVVLGVHMEDMIVTYNDELRFVNDKKKSLRTRTRHIICYQKLLAQ